jgi:arylsulfatase
VVLIFTDDQGYGDVGCYGATGFQTPNIDSLALQGIRFTNFYAAQPVCTASRAGILTGCYPNRIGFSGALFPSDTIGLSPKEKTLAEMFKEKGYATAIFGKWHLGDKKKFLPLQHGFDEYYGIPYSNDMWPVMPDGSRAKPGTWQSRYSDLPLIEGNKVVGHITDYAGMNQLTTTYTEKAIDFINRHKNKPFFLYVPHNMPHVPLGVSDKFRGKSEQGLYGDAIEEIDWSVGQILRTLHDDGLDDNTIVIFTTDNGPWLNYGNHAGSAGGLREGKTTSWEGGQRVPFIIRWPGKIPAGKICNKLACAIDLMPTLTEIVGGKLPDKKIDGVSILKLLKGDLNAEPRKDLYYYYGKNNLNAVREGNWKLVLPHTYESYNARPGKNGYAGPRVKTTVESSELYNMRRDPGEHFNVIKYHPNVAAELEKVAVKARAELGDLNVGLAKGAGSRKIGTLHN